MTVAAIARLDLRDAPLGQVYVDDRGGEVITADAEEQPYNPVSEERVIGGGGA